MQAQTTHDETAASGAYGAAADDRFLRPAEVARRYGCSAPTIWRAVSKGKLPEPVKLFDGVTGFRLSDLLRFEAEAERSNAA